MLNLSWAKSLWVEAIYTSCYLQNRSMTIAIPSRTPYEIWFSKKLNLSHLRIFGTIAHVHIPKELKQKLDRRFKKYMNVWHVEEIKGYKVYIDPKIHIIF
jgi:hypothetical protein